MSAHTASHLPRAVLALAVFFVAASAIAQAPAPGESSFVTGLHLDADIAHWHEDADAANYRGVLAAVNERVDKDGKLTLKPGERDLDFARAILLVCRVSRYKPQYFVAAKTIYDDLIASTAPLAAREAFAAVPFRVQYDVTFALPEDLPGALFSLTAPKGPVLAVHTAQQALQQLWLAAATVDTLEILPAADPHRADLVARAQSLLSVASLAPMHLWTSQDAAAGDRRNLAEYAVAKAVRLGYLQSFTNLLPGNTGVSIGESGGDPLVSLARSEDTQKQTSQTFRNANVTIDAWFNSQTRATPAGNTELFHYKWDDEADSGYSFFGRAFQRYGAHLSTLAEEPTAANLAKSNVYIIVSPDIPVKNPHPHYVAPRDVDAIAAWVQAGGVLLVFHNDNTNTEYEHFNTLMERFGIHYNPVLKNPVEGSQYAQAQVPIPAKTTGVFQQQHLAYMKEIDTISTQPPAQPVLRDTLHGSGDVYMAVSHVGKGVVFATVDPWLYNEYTDGQKLGGYTGVHFDPWPAAIDLAGWALQQTSTHK